MTKMWLFLSSFVIGKRIAAVIESAKNDDHPNPRPPVSPDETAIAFAAKGVEKTMDKKTVKAMKTFTR